MKDKKILIVEDDAATRHVLISYTHRIGACPIEARNGMDAVRMLYTEKPDMVILDLFLPQVSGYSILELYGQKKMTIPMVICSATINCPDNLEFIHGNKQFPFIEKPIGFDKFLEVVKNTFSPN